MVATELKSYLANSKMTLNQMAVKTGISKSLLYAIADEKRNPSLEKGLEILKYIGADETKQQKFVESYNKQSQNYTELAVSKDNKQKQEKLSAEVSNRLARDLDLFNACLDICNASPKGMTKGVLVEKYGLNILRKLRWLADREAIQIDGSTFKAENNRFLNFTAKSSFKFIKSAIDEQAEQFEEGEIVGGAKYRFDGLADEGLSAFSDLLKEFDSRAADLFQKYKLPTNKGGKRVIFQAMYGSLQRLLVIGLLTASLLSVSGKSLMADPNDSTGGGGGWGNIVKMFSIKGLGGK